jgi:hypothetical protein
LLQLSYYNNVIALPKLISSYISTLWPLHCTHKQAVTGKDFVAEGEQGSKEKTKAKKAAAAGGAPAEPAKNKKAERIAARLAAEQAGKGAATKDVSATACESHLS